MIESATTFLLGAALGSFLATCAYRIPRGLTVIYGRSRCPSCAALLRWYELIPVLSFVWSLGRCRRCLERISPTYPLVEIFYGGVSLLLLEQYGLSVKLVEGLVICFVLSLIALVDWRYLMISNAVLLWGFLIVFTLRVITDAHGIMIYLGSGVCALVFMLVLKVGMDRLLQREALGIGDIKLAGLLGFALRFELFFAVLWLASVFGLLLTLQPRVRFRRWGQEKLPFGAFLAIVSIGMLLAHIQYVRLLEGWLG